MVDLKGNKLPGTKMGRSMNQILKQKVQINFSFEYNDWLNETPFVLFHNYKNENFQDLINQKSLVIINKWTLMQIAGEETISVCNSILSNYSLENPAITTFTNNYLSLKLESFLIISRSILDISSTLVYLICTQKKSIQSINALRKKSDSPKWLKEYLSNQLPYNPNIPFEENKWLSLIVTDNNSPQSLRDFVTHRGIIDFSFNEIWDDEWDIVIKPRTGVDKYLISVKGVVKKIMNGINEFSLILTENLENNVS